MIRHFKCGQDKERQYLQRISEQESQDEWFARRITLDFAPLCPALLRFAPLCSYLLRLEESVLKLQEQIDTVQCTPWTSWKPEESI